MDAESAQPAAAPSEPSAAGDAFAAGSAGWGAGDGVGRAMPEEMGEGGEGGTRVLVLGWCLWLLGAWGVMWVLGGWTLPALRSMVFAGMLGLMGVWPAVRLSQPTPPWPGRGGAGAGPWLGSGGGVTPRGWLWVCGVTWGDWVALNVIFQAVIWPLRWAGGWPALQAVWLTVAVAGWSLLTGLLIAWGRGGNEALRRSGAMVACVGVVVAEPLLWWLAWWAGVLGGTGEPTMRLSPLQALWHFTAPGLGPRSLGVIVQQQGVQVVGVSASAVAGWAVLLGLLWWTRARPVADACPGAASR